MKTCLVCILLSVAQLAVQPVLAFEPGLTPVSFEGSAFLITYYSGVAEVLLDKKVIVPGATPVSGLSGGAFTVVASTLGVDGKAQRDLWKQIIAECIRLDAGCIGRLNAVVEAMFSQEQLPANVTDAVNGLVRVGISQLDASSTSLNNSATWVVDEWESARDLLSCLTSTDYIPCFTGSSTYTIFRNQPVIDGGYANGFADLCHNGADDCLKVSSWYVGPLADHTCDSGVCPAAAATNCSSADRTHQVTELYQNGEYVDQWELTQVQQRCPGSVFGSLPPYPLPEFVPHSGWNDTTIPDIYPGRYNDLPILDGRQVLACEWQSWALALPAGRELEAMDLIYQQGVDDALAWYEEYVA